MPGLIVGSLCFNVGTGDTTFHSSVATLEILISKLRHKSLGFLWGKVDCSLSWGLRQGTEKPNTCPLLSGPESLIGSFLKKTCMQLVPLVPSLGGLSEKQANAMERGEHLEVLESLGRRGHSCGSVLETLSRRGIN